MTQIFCVVPKSASAELLASLSALPLRAPLTLLSLSEFSALAEASHLIITLEPLNQLGDPSTLVARGVRGVLALSDDAGFVLPNPQVDALLVVETLNTAEFQSPRVLSRALELLYFKVESLHHFVHGDLVQQRRTSADVVSGLSHELNNHLMVIMGKTDLMMHGLKSGRWDTEKVLEAGQKILDSSLRMSRSIETFRALADFDREPQQMKFSDLVDAVSRMARKKLAPFNLELIPLAGTDFYLKQSPAEFSHALLQFLERLPAAVSSWNCRQIEMAYEASESEIELIFRPQQVEGVVAPSETLALQALDFAHAPDWGVMTAHDGGRKSPAHAYQSQTPLLKFCWRLSVSLDSET